MNKTKNKILINKEKIVTKLIAVGMFSGIGSMLLAARQAGFKVLGGMDSWKQFNTGTFERNFPGAFFLSKPGEPDLDFIKDLGPVDLVVGMPACLYFSSVNISRAKYCSTAGDLPHFAKLVSTIRPRYFFMDNLPKSITVFTIDMWMDALKDYDLYPELVSNYGYGNCQINRERLIMVGAQKKEKYVFIPGEVDEHDYMTLRDVIGDLPNKRDIKEINHMHFPDDWVTGWKRRRIIRNGGERKLTVGELKAYIKKNLEGNKKELKYFNVQGEVKRKYTSKIVPIDGPCNTILGGSPEPFDGVIRADTLNTFTIREKARVLGFPDSFIFHPLDFQDRSKSRLDLNDQVGKCIPVEFCRFAAKQIVAHIKGKTFKKATGHRIRRRWQHLPLMEAKVRYCEVRGYGRLQKKACRFCGSKHLCDLRIKKV